MRLFNYNRLMVTLLVTLFIAVSAMPARADVTIWVKSATAPHVYAWDNDNTELLGAWPGTKLTQQSDGWWLCYIAGDAPANVVINDGSGEHNPNQQSADITNLTGTHYFYYNGASLHLDVTPVRDAAAYAFLQPNGAVNWDQDGAVFTVDGQQLEPCGGYNGGNAVYLWTADTEKTGTITFCRMGPGDVQWNTFSSEYHKGGFYENSDWNAGSEVDTQFRDLVFPTGVVVNAENFPDDNFRACILEQTYGSDALLTETELSTITTLEVGNKGIASLQGIHYFQNLKKLTCGNNNLTSLPLNINGTAGNPNLEELSCGSNQLTAIDVTKNTALKSLNCEKNQLTTLDVSNNTALTTLICGENQLQSLDVSTLASLSVLHCDNNQLSSLNLDNNPQLTIIYAHSNQLQALNVDNNPRLLRLACRDNQIGSLNVDNQTVMTHLDCSNNLLKTLDVTKNTKLTHLVCDNNALRELNVSNNTALTRLDCNYNQLTELNLQGLTKIAILNYQGQVRNIEAQSFKIDKENESKRYYYFRLDNHTQGINEENIISAMADSNYTHQSNFMPGNVNNWLSGGKTIEGKRDVTVADGEVTSDMIYGDILLLTSYDEQNGTASGTVTYTYNINFEGNGAVNGDNQSPFTLNWKASATDVVTAIDNTLLSREPVSVTYHNLAGVASERPFSGMNIVVTRYSDGTTATSKLLK